MSSWRMIGPPELLGVMSGSVWRSEICDGGLHGGLEALSRERRLDRLLVPDHVADVADVYAMSGHLAGRTVVWSRRATIGVTAT